MSWTRKLATPVKLKDGRTVTTLAEVRELMVSIPPRYRQGAVWRYLGEFLGEAANDRATVAEVEEMLLKGLKGAGLL